MDWDKLAKVLAMAESEHPGEALSALRAARVLLAREGLVMRDLARPNGVGRAAASDDDDPPLTQTGRRAFERAIVTLETELKSVRADLADGAAALAHERQESRRWRRLAQETAEHLWDLGHRLEGDADAAAAMASAKATATTVAAGAGPAVDRRAGTVEALMRLWLADRRLARLSDLAIARAFGVPPRLVALMRRRAAGLRRRAARSSLAAIAPIPACGAGPRSGRGHRPRRRRGRRSLTAPGGSRPAR